MPLKGPAHADVVLRLKDEPTQLRNRIYTKANEGRAGMITRNQSYAEQYHRFA
jgi:hypothetical protein